MIKAICAAPEKYKRVIWPKDFLVLPSIGHTVEGIDPGEGYDDPWPVALKVVAVIHKYIKISHDPRFGLMPGYVADDPFSKIPAIVIKLGEG